MVSLKREDYGGTWTEVRFHLFRFKYFPEAELYLLTNYKCNSKVQTSPIFLKMSVLRCLQNVIFAIIL